MSSVKRNNRYARFTLQLPSSDEFDYHLNENEDEIEIVDNANSHASKNGIPVSKIAIQLNQNIRKCLVLQLQNNPSGSSVSTVNSKDFSDDILIVEEDENGKDGNCKPVDDCTVKLGGAIIDAFQALYNKYVSEYAQHMINVDSKNRSALKKIFDDNISTFLSTKKSHVRQSSSIGRWLARPSTIMVTSATNTGGVLGMNSKGKGNNAFDNNNNGTSVNHGIKIKKVKIKSDFERYCKDNVNLKEDEAIEWLLTQLITTMEPAVLEISNLMNDSFTRFKKDTELFGKVLKLAKKFYQHK